MRKMKKINGYLVVRFNDREKRQDETLGSFGVIDAELYTGHLGIDRSAMDYDSAATIEEAVEQARGLNAEEDYTNEEPTVTVVRETADRTEEKTVDAQTMIAGWDSTLSGQIKSDDYPDVVPETARHELYGYKAALKELGAITDDECFVEPRHFEPEDVPSGEPGEKKEPSGERTTLCEKCPLQGKSEDLTALGKLLSEIEDYTKSDAPQTNAEALEHHIRREKQRHNETLKMLDCLANGVPNELKIDKGGQTAPQKMIIPQPKLSDADKAALKESVKRMLTEPDYGKGYTLKIDG